MSDEYNPNINDPNKPICPMCGKPTWELFEFEQENYEHKGLGTRVNDHAACAIALSQENSKLREQFASLQHDFTTVVETAVKEYLKTQYYWETTGSGHRFKAELTEEEKKTIGNRFRTKLLNAVITDESSPDR